MTAVATFRGVTLDERGGVTIDGDYYNARYIAAASEGDSGGAPPATVQGAKEAIPGADEARTSAPSRDLNTTLDGAAAEGMIRTQDAASDGGPWPLASRTKGGIPSDTNLPPILALAHGMHRGFPDALYHARVEGLASKHALDEVRKSAAHFRAWVEGAMSDPDTPALAFGRALDCALLEPDVYASRFVAEPKHGDLRTNAAKARRAEFRAPHVGKQFVDLDDARTIDGMIAAVRAHPLAGPLLRGGDRQLTLRWRDPSSGIECKARPDFYAPDIATVVDIKTAEDASLAGFRRALARFAYHRQEAFYREGFDVLGAPVEAFLFVAIEKEPPFAIGVYAIDYDALTKGRASIRRDLETLARCYELDDWPSYPADVQTIELAPWAEW